MDLDQQRRCQGSFVLYRSDGGSVFALSALSHFLCAPTTIQIRVFPVTCHHHSQPCAIHSSQDEDALQIAPPAKILHMFKLVRAANHPPSWPSICPGSPLGKVHEQTSSSTHQTKHGWQGFLHWSNNHHNLISKHASSNYLPPPST